MASIPPPPPKTKPAEGDVASSHSFSSPLPKQSTTTTTTTTTTNNHLNSNFKDLLLNNLSFVRGVNLGGWLVMERYITPYQFAVTDCHVRGDFCWYPGQVSAPPFSSDKYRECDLLQCKPLLFADDAAAKGKDSDNPVLVYDYPVDEYTLAQAFGTATPQQVETATAWFNAHFEHFLTRSDIQAIAASGLTHVRVPLPHWILGHVEMEHENKDVTTAITGTRAPWIVGDRWKYFKRMVGWCREAGLQVWPDIHTAPGSQNGFDNSGHQQEAVSCRGWSGNPEHVAFSLQVLQDVTSQIVTDGLQDVVTGFGLLNEPFKDCHREVYEQFLEDGLDIVRNTLGPQTAVYVSDMFLAKTFNNGQWWMNKDSSSGDNIHESTTRTSAAASAATAAGATITTATATTTAAAATATTKATPTALRYNNTYLDSHYYQVFAVNPRGMSPRQHIAYVCQNAYADVLNCCYRDATPNDAIDDGRHGGGGNDNNNNKHKQPRRRQHPNTRPQDGVRRLVGEWSAATDKLPVAILRQVMDGIAATGLAPQLDRTLSPKRQAFLKHYMQAQMVAYEAVGSNGDATDTSTAGLSAGWFYWNFKMEGGAFAEWDYLRAVREGWMPTLPASPTTPSQDVYGTCYDIIFRTDDDMSVIHEFPDAATTPVPWWEDPIDDDVVVSHGDSLTNVNGHYIQPVRHGSTGQHIQMILFVLLAAVLAVLAVWRTRHFWTWLFRLGSQHDKIYRDHPYEPVGEARILTGLDTDVEDDYGDDSSSSVSSKSGGGAAGVGRVVTA